MTYTDALLIINNVVNRACQGLTPTVSEIPQIQTALQIVNDGPGGTPPHGPKG
jgi:hypothetical protein